MSSLQSYDRLRMVSKTSTTFSLSVFLCPVTGRLRSNLPHGTHKGTFCIVYLSPFVISDFFRFLIIRLAIC
jgi:hypothetical protein